MIPADGMAGRGLAHGKKKMVAKISSLVCGVLVTWCGGQLTLLVGEGSGVVYGGGRSKEVEREDRRLYVRQAYYI